MKRKKTKEPTLTSMIELYKKRGYKRPEIMPIHLCAVIEQLKRDYESSSRKT